MEALWGEGLAVGAADGGASLAEGEGDDTTGVMLGQGCKADAGA